MLVSIATSSNQAISLNPSVSKPVLRIGNKKSRYCNQGSFGLVYINYGSLLLGAMS
ncbi:hypothetical protein [Rubripirellula lacrimiformis]|uniref:hypothetical protein n=1 Tax=Rubripirellula lacrimiformis TaxID=1930273 RepID=UPI001C54D477|nr:hypothetical protein [Rubripirellula lacrimiformis]